MNKVNACSPGDVPALAKPESMWLLAFKRLKRNKVAYYSGYVLLLLIIIAIVGPYFTTFDPFQVDYTTKFLTPSAEHWFGTDHHGRDIFTRVIHGMSITLYIGFSSVFLGMIVGVPIGIISGYYGKYIDTVLMRLVDILLAFPGFLLAVALSLVFGTSINSVIFVVAIWSIAHFARVARGSTLAVKNLEYIDAIRALGAGDSRIIYLHILPNIVSPLIVQATLRIAISILIAAALSFLGLGAQPPTPEWGAMLSAGRNFLYDYPHIALYPGLAITLVVLVFNIFGDGVRDAFDPR